MKKLCLINLFLFVCVLSFAQVKMPAPSPTQIIKQDFAIGNIELKYSRPSAKGRKVFGELVQYNKLWRTGANAATNPLCVNNQPVGLGDGPATGLSKANFGATQTGGSSNVAGLENAGTQAPVTPTITPEANKNAGVQGGGGGGLGASSAAANNDLGQQGGGASGGPNADIMQGTSGGNGFSGYASAPQTGGGDGGFSGYGGGTGRSAGSGFNLAQYLPGGAKAAAGRGLAGAGGIVAAKAELGNPGDNIWIRPTRRMGIMCQQNRLECGVK